MNKFITGIAGIMPFWQRDIEFFFDTIEEVTRGLSSVLGENYILSGVTETHDSDWTISSGWAVINGEVCQVEEQWQHAEPTGYWRVESTEDDESERTFELESNGVKEHKVWQRRKAVLATSDDDGAVKITLRADNYLNRINNLVPSHEQITTFISDLITKGYVYYFQYGKLIIAHGFIQVGMTSDENITFDVADFPTPYKNNRVYIPATAYTEKNMALFVKGELSKAGRLSFYIKYGLTSIYFNFSYLIG